MSLTSARARAATGAALSRLGQPPPFRALPPHYDCNLVHPYRRALPFPFPSAEFQAPFMWYQASAPSREGTPLNEDTFFSPTTLHPPGRNCVVSLLPLLPPTLLLDYPDWGFLAACRSFRDAVQKAVFGTSASWTKTPLPIKRVSALPPSLCVHSV